MSPVGMVISLFPLIAGGVLVLLGLVLLVRGIRGEAELSFPTCGKCGYDLRNRDLTGLANCPECGKSMHEPRAVKFGKYRRRPWMIVTGAAMVVVPIALVLGIATLSMQQQVRMAGNMGAAQTNAQLIQSLAIAANQPWAWNELTNRYQQGRLSDEEIASALDQLITHLETAPLPPNQPLTWAIGFVQMAFDTGDISKQQRERLCKAYYASTPIISMPKRIHAGKNVRFMTSGTHWDLPGQTTAWQLRSVKFRDQDVLLGATQSTVRGPFSRENQLFLEAEPGLHELVFEVDVGVVDEETMHSDSRLRFEPNDVWNDPSLLHRWLKIMTIPVHVVPRDQPRVEAIEDPTAKDGIRNCIAIRRVRYAENARGKSLLFYVNTTNMPEHSVSFDILLCFAGREVEVGEFWWANTGLPSERSFRFPCDLPENVNTVTFKLRSNPLNVEGQWEFDQIWSGELVFENVPVVRETD